MSQEAKRDPLWENVVASFEKMDGDFIDGPFRKITIQIMPFRDDRLLTTTIIIDNEDYNHSVILGHIMTMLIDRIDDEISKEKNRS